MGLLERTKVVVCRHAPSPSPQSAPLAALAALFSPKSQRLQSHAITCNPSGQHRKSASPKLLVRIRLWHAQLLGSGVWERYYFR